MSDTEKSVFAAIVEAWAPGDVSDHAINVLIKRLDTAAQAAHIDEHLVRLREYLDDGSVLKAVQRTNPAACVVQIRQVGLLDHPLYSVECCDSAPAADRWRVWQGSFTAKNLCAWVVKQDPTATDDFVFLSNELQDCELSDRNRAQISAALSRLYAKASKK